MSADVSIQVLTPSELTVSALEWVEEVTTLYRFIRSVCLQEKPWFAGTVHVTVVLGQVRFALLGSLRVVGGAAALLLLLGACSQDTSSDVDTGPSHSLEPTDQMRDLATQQCLDDPNKDQGIVRAVEPGSDGEDVFAEVVIECDTVR